MITIAWDGGKLTVREDEVSCTLEFITNTLGVLEDRIRFWRNGEQITKEVALTSIDDPANHQGCLKIILDIEHDPYARLAIRSYIDACIEVYPQRAQQFVDILNDHPYRGKK